MSDREPSPPQYEKPSVSDYGTLSELTAVTLPGLPFGVAAISSPLVPGPGPGGPDIPVLPSGAGDVSSGGEQGAGGGGDFDSGGGGGDGGIAGAGDGGVPGVEGGGGSSTGGGDASLPFTGFPAAIAAAAGAAMAASGAALRRALRRRHSSS